MAEPAPPDEGPVARRGEGFAWLVTTVAVLLSGCLVWVLLTFEDGELPEVSMPQITAGGCPKLGIAGPAAWEGMTEEEFREMLEEQVTLGATWIRISASWHEIERYQGYLYWEGLDMRIEAAVDAGLRPLLLIHTLPTWVTGFGVTGSGAAEEYGNFAGAVAQRYGRDVEAYEVWNEPNIERFWPDPDPAAYAELLVDAVPKIRAADPTATVIAGGMAPASNVPGLSYSGYSFLAGLYELDALSQVDALAMHPYSYPERPSGMSQWNTFRQLASIKALMRSHGDGHKAIWLTEFGAPTAGEGGVGEREQAAMVSEALRLSWPDPGLGPLFIYTMYDLDFGEEDRESHFGLMYGPGMPKPAFTQLRELAGQCNEDLPEWAG